MLSLVGIGNLNLQSVGSFEILVRHGQTMVGVVVSSNSEIRNRNCVLGKKRPGRRNGPRPMEHKDKYAVRVGRAS